MCECGCYRARRISFHLFIYLFIYVCFFFLCFGTRIFFCHTVVSFYSTYVPLFNSNKNNKAVKALIFFSDKPNFISPNFIITPTRRVWLVSYYSQEFSYLSVFFFFASFSFFLFSLLHFSTFLPLKVEEKQSLCHETAKWLTRRKSALDWTPVSGRFCIWANASAKTLQLPSSFRVLSFFLPFTVSLYVKHTEISNRQLLPKTTPTSYT